MPQRVYICKQAVLEQALEALSLKMHGAKTCIIGNDEIVGSVCIDVPPHGDHPFLHKRNFFGDYKLTAKDALESANVAALLYLQKAGIIAVDDINSSELADCQAKLVDCQHKLLAASNWATMFQECADSLQVRLTSTSQENQKLVATIRVLTVFENARKGSHFTALVNVLISLLLFRQAFSVKKEILTPQAAGVKEEVFTTPSHNHAGASSSQYKKRRIVPSSSVRKPLFQE